VELQSSRRDKDPGIDIRELAENKLEKPSQKCGGFSVNCCNTVAIAPINSLFRSAVVHTGSTDRQYRQAPSVYIDGWGQSAEVTFVAVIE
jgi:hypothetical protein